MPTRGPPGRCPSLHGIGSRCMIGKLVCQQHPAAALQCADTQIHLTSWRRWPAHAEARVLQLQYGVGTPQGSGRSHNQVQAG